MKKRNVIILLLVLVTVIVFVGIFFLIKNNTKNKVSSNIQEQVEYMNSINTNSTVEQINDILKVKGIVDDNDSNKYYWELSDEVTIEVTYTKNGNCRIELIADNDNLVNNKVKINDVNTLKSKVNEGITYDEFKKEVGDVDGVLLGNSTVSKKYIWVASDGSYIKATFSNTNDKCIFMSVIKK